MSSENKGNVHYFEAASMKSLFERMQSWQDEGNERFLSLGIEKDGGSFCCIALTNPTEVVIVNGGGWGGRAYVESGALRVTSHSF